MRCNRQRTETRSSARRTRRYYGSTVAGFTLVELLVVMGTLTLLVGILLPSLSRARGQAKATVCQSNLRQIVLANSLYAQDSGGVYVPGAADFLDNRHRWHGERAALYAPFDSSHGPLVPYLGSDGVLRACPTFERRLVGFEAGCGGYGYNNAYLGVRIVAGRQGRSIVVSDRAGAYADRVQRPADTVMFTDSAFAGEELIEYSFCEPRFHVQFGTRADPSIHFRHARTANAAWCDGHVNRETRTFTWSSGYYSADPKDFDIGWFGMTDDNKLFDLR